MTTEAERPDAPALADRAASWRGVYLHVPFCRRVCPYCDFAVIAGADHLRDRYVAALQAEIAMVPPLPGPVDAVAFGGGTPSRLSAADLARLLETLASWSGIAAGAEVSLEANPEDCDRRMLADLAAAGFTRLSLGAQSFDPEVLAELGRCHRPDDTRAAVAAAREAGFASVSIDLIFGSPVETSASWEGSVAAALECGVDHLSTYALTVERGTPLSRAVAAGAPGPDPDRQAERYEWMLEAVEGAGLVRYETSNHARPGHACRYNLLTWAQGEYEGFGAGAHRHRDRDRAWNVRRVDRYLDRVEAGTRPESGGERLEGGERDRERVLLGLRRAGGVVPGESGGRLLASPPGRRLQEAGVLAVRGGRLVVTRPLLGDEVSRALLALTMPEC